MPLDLAGTHAAGVDRDNFLAEAGKPPLIFGDQLRIEALPDLAAGGVSARCPHQRAGQFPLSRAGRGNSGPGNPSLTVEKPVRGYAAGFTFKLTRNMFSGSYLALSATNLS